MLRSFKIHKNYDCDIQIVPLNMFHPKIMYVCIICNQLKEQIGGHIFLIIFLDVTTY